MTHNPASAAALTPYDALLQIKKRQEKQRRRKQEAQMVQTEIAQFESNREKLLSCGLTPLPCGQDDTDDPTPSRHEVSGRGSKAVQESGHQYIQEIRQRLRENAEACEQRERRRDRFLVEQLRAHEAQEEKRRQEALVRRLTRQTQQEQRLAAQLLQMRKQKEVIRENRFFREQLYQQRRERDFQEALEREATLARQAKLDRAEELRMELEICDKIAAESTQRRYEKRKNTCRLILEQIVDLAVVVGEYRLLTANLIPAKLMREWKELLFMGLPLYEPINTEEIKLPAVKTDDPVDLQKLEILNNQDYDDYTNITGEWAWPEEAGEASAPPGNNNILGHIVLKLRNLVNPPVVEVAPPSFPRFTLKASVLGKFCSGKSTCLAKLAQAHGVHVLSADLLVQEALTAYQNGEKVKKEREEKDKDRPVAPRLKKSDSSSRLHRDSGPVCQEEGGNRRLSTRALQGAAVQKELQEGNAVPDKLVVDIIVEAIRTIPAFSCWVLDGFPVDVAQAHLLEKALGGTVDRVKEVVISRTDLVNAPNAPKPPPPAPPMLDLVLLLDVSDECAAERALSRDGLRSKAAAPKNPPPQDNSTQIPHRIMAFKESWPKLEEWYGGKQNILVCVDADADEDELCRRAEAVMLQVIAQSPQSSGLVDQPAGATNLDQGLMESCWSLHEERDGLDQSRRASVSSLTIDDTQGPTKKQRKSSPYPGSPGWVFVDEPLSFELAENLCRHWDIICESYVNNVKMVMRLLRAERTLIDNHLYNIRQEYMHYLGRPDLKQELVSQWQKDFNSIPDDMRADEDTKAELHQRLDDLRERLWDISDKRKEEDEKEVVVLKNDGWLEDHTAILINHHSRLMQVELNRFQDTFCILKDYYMSMYKQGLPDQPSNFVCLSLLDIPDLNDQKESNADPAVATVTGHRNEGEDAKKNKHIPLVCRQPDNSGAANKNNGQEQPAPAKPLQDKLTSDNEEALKAIRKWVTGEAHRGQYEMQEPKEKVEEEEKEKPPVIEPKKSKGGKQTSKKQKDSPAPAPEASPPPSTEEPVEKINPEKKKIHKEYSAALKHEEQSTRVRLSLVKGHGLLLVQSLQNRVEEVFVNMRKSLREHYLADMASIDQLAEVVCHHIESCSKLQCELVLECTDFFMNGDYHFVASPPPPLRPLPIEKPNHSTLSIVQLESLRCHMYNMAPSGFISSSELFALLRDLMSVNMGRNILPEPWINMSETQLTELVCLLTDDYELVDWRQFLLSSALPWPQPSIAQLLALLRRFKALDPGNTGYISLEQYLQTELWFSSEGIQWVPEDPYDPLPYDRLANLREFFFQLFADSSISPPRLDYVSTLLYFTADPNPKRGLNRALCLMDLHLKGLPSALLDRSLPSMEEAGESGVASPDVENQGEGSTSCSLPEDQEVSIPGLLAVTCHKLSRVMDATLPPGCMNQEETTQHLVQIFAELGYNQEDHVPLSILSQHPSIQGLTDSSLRHQLVDIHQVLLACHDEGDTATPPVS